MGDLAAVSTNLRAKMNSRSMGLKLIVVCGLAMLMMIPALFVYSLVVERTQRATEVTDEISGLVGGKQSFLGPTLIVPYRVPLPEVKGATVVNATLDHGVYIVFPAQAEATVKTHTEERHRLLFKVPVFQAELALNSTFDLTGVPSSAPANAVLDWNRAEIVVGVSDARGALADATMSINGKMVTLVPAGNGDEITQDDRHRLTFFGISAGEAAQPNARFKVSSSLRFSGAQRIAVLAYGKTTHLSMAGDWPNPSFDGGFLPVNRSISQQGFTGEWLVPFIARGVRPEGLSNLINGLDANALGVSFVEMADPYQSVTRSLKYALLFLGLLFLSYFVFEVTTGKRVHPAQYILVGVAQIIFYLLLLSLAERIGFDMGFLIAGAATVLLLSANAAWIFVCRKQGYRALVCFSLFYALIYLLLRLEDNALLVGAVASFLAVAAVMYFTRRIDWYGSLPSAVPQAEEVKSGVQNEVE
jgi:inner membrane protein